MYVKKFYLTILTITLTSLSCQYSGDRGKPVENEFEEVQPATISDTLSPSKIHQLSDELTLVNSFEMVNVYDSYLVISEQRSEDFITVFELPSMNYLYSFGRVSRGPEVYEFSSVPVFLDTYKNQLVVHDAILGRVRFIEIDTNNIRTLDEKSLSYDGQLEPLHRVRLMNKNLFFADYGTSIEQTEREFVALEPDNSDSLFTFGTYPESEFGEYPDDASESFRRYNRFMKENLSSPDGTRYAAFYFRDNKFKIFNQSGDELVAVNVNDPLLEDDLSDDFIFRTTGWASNNYIYTLGLNGSWSELSDHPDPDENRKTTFEVWNWNGEPIYRAHFDRGITNFTLSEEHGRIYGLSASEQDVIFEYEIPQF